MEYDVVVGVSNISMSSSFARAWFEDAFNEAQTGQDHNSRRREIIFSICFAESYLFEWVRDEVLQRQYTRLRIYFPPRKKRGVDEKWRDIPKRLHDAKLIPQLPDFRDPHGKEWNILIKYRDGLVHAVASRPQTTSQAVTERPVPSKTELGNLKAGWAIRVVIERVRRLHKATGTLMPSWLVNP